MVSAEHPAEHAISAILCRDRQVFDETRDETLTNPISSDGILTQQAHQRPAERPTKDSDHQVDASAASPDKAASTADVERAQQRLAQEAARSEASGAEGPEQAQALVDRLAQQIAADPRGAMRAAGQVNETLFEAATTRPTA